MRHLPLSSIPVLSGAGFVDLIMCKTKSVQKYEKNLYLESARKAFSPQNFVDYETYYVLNINDFWPIIGSPELFSDNSVELKS